MRVQLESRRKTRKRKKKEVRKGRGRKIGMSDDVTRKKGKQIKDVQRLKDSLCLDYERWERY